MSSAATSFTTRWHHLRTLLSASAVLLLVVLARTKDVFSDFTRPTVTLALHLLGIGAQDHGTTIAVGRLEVPWTRDCAGLNLLLVITALTIWLNRSEPADRRYWCKLALTIPAAVLANVLRVLSLIGYREAFYPNVESPQLHYFLGLVWLLPFLAFFVPRGSRKLSHVMVESLQAAAVIALLAPMSGVPGGSTITIAALIGLSQCRVQTDALRARRVLSLGWMALAVGICLLGMESLWLPWLFLCPVVASRRWLGSVTGVVLTLATYPLVGMIPGALYGVWAAMAWWAWEWYRGSNGDAAVPAALPVSKVWRFAPVAVSVCFVLPFIASTVFARTRESFTPPAETTFTAVAADTFEVQIPGQPANIGLAWFNPAGNGRHHSMKVCMKYRGIELEPSKANADVFTDGEHWMREFYIVDSRIVPSYRAYLLNTFRPCSSPGVHLIFYTKSDQMTPDEFNASCQHLAAVLDSKRVCAR